jgi:hypothetical protein
VLKEPARTQATTPRAGRNRLLLTDTERPSDGKVKYLHLSCSPSTGSARADYFTSQPGMVVVAEPLYRMSRIVAGLLAQVKSFLFVSVRVTAAGS